MKQRIYNGHPLEFFNSSNDKKAEIKISGSDLILNPLDSSGTVIIGEAGTINDIEVFVPINENNRDYQEILKWVDAGNTIEEAD